MSVSSIQMRPLFRSYLRSHFREQFLTNMSVFALLPVVFFKNIFVFLDLVVFYIKCIIIFYKIVHKCKYSFLNISTFKCAKISLGRRISQNSQIRRHIFKHTLKKYKIRHRICITNMSKYAYVC